MKDRLLEIDDRELVQLEIDLRGAPTRMQFGVTRILKTRGGPILADAMRADARGHRGNYFGKPGTEFVTPLDKHVSYEMIDDNTVEAGIEYSGAGKLAHIIVYGSANNAPVYDKMAGPRRVLPRIVRLFEDVAEDSVLGDET
jgi:hypothetical protein